MTTGLPVATVQVAFQPGAAADFRRHVGAVWATLPESVRQCEASDADVVAVDGAGADWPLLAAAAAQAGCRALVIVHPTVGAVSAVSGLVDTVAELGTHVFVDRRWHDGRSARLRATLSSRLVLVDSFAAVTTEDLRTVLLEQVALVEDLVGAEAVPAGQAFVGSRSLSAALRVAGVPAQFGISRTTVSAGSVTATAYSPDEELHLTVHDTIVRRSRAIHIDRRGSHELPPSHEAGSRATWRRMHHELTTASATSDDLQRLHRRMGLLHAVTAG